MVRLRHGLDHAAVGDAHLRDGADAGRRGEQPPPPGFHHSLEVRVARDHDQDARTHVTLVSAMSEKLDNNYRQCKFNFQVAFCKGCCDILFNPEG